SDHFDDEKAPPKRARLVTGEITSSSDRAQKTLAPELYEFATVEQAGLRRFPQAQLGVSRTRRVTITQDCAGFTFEECSDINVLGEAPFMSNERPDVSFAL